MAKDKNPAADADLKKYRSLSGVSLKEMNFGLWLAQKRRIIFQIFTGCLIAVCAGLLLYSAYGYIIYFLNGEPALTGGIPESPRDVTSPLAVGAPLVLASDGHYDLAAQVSNPNDKFSGTFNYCFVAGGADIFCGSGFLLPGEEKYVLALGQNPASTADVSFQAADVSWQRLDAHQIPDWSAFSASRLNFVISGLSFQPGDASRSDKVSLNSLSFSAANQTPYGYYEAPLDILFYEGDQLIGTQRYILDNFLPGETRAVKITWPGRLDGVTRTEVRPDINILDDSVYLPYQGAAKP